MEQSTNYNFNLPSKNDETSADVDLISDNFRTVDDIVKQVQDDVSKTPTNLVNGSAEGSLRGINAKAENDEYIMREDAVALGYGTEASGRISHAEGSGTTASGDISHAEGLNTIASSYCQHAQGKYNIADNDNKYLHIVGNGEAEGDRSNAHTLDWSGNAWFAGDVYVGGTSQDDESATKLSSVAEKLKNHTSFSVFTSDANAKTYIKLGKFTGDGAGGRAIFTINGKVGWNNKNDGGLKVLTLSSNDSRDTISTGIFTGGSFFDFGHSDNDGTSIIEDTPDIQVAIVRPSDYTVKEVDIYLKFAPNKYNSYLITVDYSGTCKWETDVKPVNATDPDPMETALSSYIVPKKRFGDLAKVNSALETKVTREVAVVGSDKANSAGWYKVADGTVYPNTDVSMLFAVHSTEGTKSAGILQLNLRSTSSTTTCQQFGWLVRNGFNPNNLIIATDGRSWAMYFKVLSTQYYRTFFEVIQKSSTNSSTLAGGYALYTNSVVETAEPTATYTSTDLGVIKTINERISTKADVETGNCTLTVSNGDITDATYSVVGDFVTLNFKIAPTGAGNIVVSGLPFATAKNQSGVASSTATFNITANQTSVSINSTSGTAEYCTVTYLK